ncbi:hypothetical protein DENIS_3435 [Desulfonema ishimotonii]|uniref:Uncharacterized protein n=1 Tax=Desulfonema ishimotonii TaxID=45657 RepID=A0A401FZV1_9BACT|nr:hypothetical protein [Desulfonema ishimotonii]GBC62463.1 hypothetical protein DENIS_3435 [Desulfonema ishimotonii]
MGDELAVVSGGKLIKSPTGLPAGWIPGPTKGRLKVVQLFGKDFAVGKLIDGQGPKPADLLMKP